MTDMKEKILAASRQAFCAKVASSVLHGSAPILCEMMVEAAAEADKAIAKKFADQARGLLLGMAMRFAQQEAVASGRLEALREVAVEALTE